MIRKHLLHEMVLNPKLRLSYQKHYSIGRFLFFLHIERPVFTCQSVSFCGRVFCVSQKQRWKERDAVKPLREEVQVNSRA